MPLALLPNVVWHSLVGQPARFASGAGGRWLEFGRPSLLAVKEARLPAGGAPRPPARVAHDFRRRSLADALAPHAGVNSKVAVSPGVGFGPAGEGFVRFALVENPPYIIYLVTENDAGDINRAFKAGADDYLLKPFNRDIVEMKLHEIAVAA